MKLSLKRIGAAAGLLGIVAGPVIGLTAQQASAIPPVEHPGQTLASAGSDTIYWVTAAMDTAYNNNTMGLRAINKDADVAQAIPPVVVAPFPTSMTTRADANCGAITYDSGNLPPNGSSAGISALVADNGTGCIDYARSSRLRKGTDPANIDFWSFGLDALDVGVFPTTKAPHTGLTQTQIIQIYTCDPTTGAPYIGDWHDLNPHAPVGSLIQKFAPQTQSGTYSFFNSKILNGATIDAGCDANHRSTFLEEHNATGVPTASKPFAIIPFSYAQWNSDKHHLTPDLRNGVKEIKINGVAPGPKTINEGPNRFLGTRYVSNVTMPIQPDYTDVLRFVGADNSGAGYICGGKAKAIIKKYGFMTLPPAATGTTSSGTVVTLNTQCRVNPTAL